MTSFLCLKETEALVAFDNSLFTRNPTQVQTGAIKIRSYRVEINLFFVSAGFIFHCKLTQSEQHLLI